MSALLYGFMGAHRTGKTTLAREVAEDMGVPFYATNVGRTLKNLRVDPQADMRFKERLAIQELILEALMHDYAQAREEFPEAPLIIVDRTPLDVVGYTLSEVLRETVVEHPDLPKILAAHEERCFELTNFNFVGFTLVPPGVKLEDQAGKGTANKFYQRHVHATMLITATDMRNKVNTMLLGLDNLALEDRTNDSADHLQSILSDDEQFRHRLNPNKSQITIH